jgi:hypothetical protein
MAITAHCGGLGTAWDTPQGERVGTVRKINTANDVAWLNGQTYDGYVFTTTSASGWYGAEVTGGEDLKTGQSYCTSGATTFWHCGHAFIAYRTYSGGVSNGVALLSNASVAGGDSGAPVVYVKSDGSLGIRGVLNGIWTEGSTSYIWATRWPIVESLLGINEIEA